MSVIIGYRQTPFRNGLLEHISRLMDMLIEIAYTTKRKHKCSSP